jgi:hypothetical protein
MQCHLESTAGCGMTEIGDAHNVTIDHDSFKRRLRLYQQHDATNFWYSSKSGIISSVKHHIENMEQPLGERDDFENTAIYYACLCGHVDVVAYLLSHYEQGEHHLLHHERYRCMTNALNGEIRRLLQEHRDCCFSYEKYVNSAAEKVRQDAEKEDDDDVAGFGALFDEGAGY